MTIEQSEISAKRDKCGPTKPGQEGKAEAGRRAVPHQWFHRVSVWRSVAGMAVAFALACAAVALETAFESSSRSASFHRHLELLGARVSRLRTEVADAKRQLAPMNTERDSTASISRVLTATDVAILRLRDGGTNARGLLALSSSVGAAIVVVSGLSATVGQTCLVWWLLAKGPPLVAAQFKPDADGRVLLAIRLPRGGYRIAGAVLTLESGKFECAGGIVLKGVFPRPEGLN